MRLSHATCRLRRSPRTDGASFCCHFSRAPWCYARLASSQAEQPGASQVVCPLLAAEGAVPGLFRRRLIDPTEANINARGTRATVGHRCCSNTLACCAYMHASGRRTSCARTSGILSAVAQTFHRILVARGTFTGFSIEPNADDKLCLLYAVCLAPMRSILRPQSRYLYAQPPRSRHISSVPPRLRPVLRTHVHMQHLEQITHAAAIKLISWRDGGSIYTQKAS